MMLMRLALSGAAVLIAASGMTLLQTTHREEVRDSVQRALQAADLITARESQAPRLARKKHADGRVAWERDAWAELRARQRVETAIKAYRFGPADAGRLQVLSDESREELSNRPGKPLLVAYAPIAGAWGWTVRAELPLDLADGSAEGQLALMGRHPVAATLWLGTVLGLLWLAARQRRPVATAPTHEAAPLWSTAPHSASPEAIARLEALARDNEHLKQELLARGEQLKQVTDSVKQRREAQAPRVTRTPA